MFWPKLQRVVFVVFLISAISSLFVWQIFGDDLDIKQLQQHMTSFGLLAPIIFFVIFIFLSIFVPATPLMAVGGILFGFKYGLLYVFIGSLISSEIVFFVSRKFGKEKTEILLNHKYLKIINKYNHRLESGGFWDLVILRIFPIMPFNILNILMGISKINKKKYLAATFIGIIPSCLLGVYLGKFVSTIF